MKKYIFIGILFAFAASTALAQFGDILEQVVTEKAKQKAGLATGQFKACQISQAPSARIPASSNLARHIEYDYNSGNWMIHVQCANGKYELKANSYKDANDISDLVRNGKLGAFFDQGSFKGFYLGK